MVMVGSKLKMKRATAINAVLFAEQLLSRRSKLTKV